MTESRQITVPFRSCSTKLQWPAIETLAKMPKSHRATKAENPRKHLKDICQVQVGGDGSKDHRDPALRPISDLNFDELQVGELAGMALFGNPVGPCSRIHGIRSGLSLVLLHQTFLRVELD